MLKKLKYPWLYVVELGVWFPFMAGFYIAMSFLAATPVANLELHGKSLPQGWEAAVPNHGKFLQGYIIGNHPLTFACGIALLGAGIAIYPIRKAQAWQSQAENGKDHGKHKAANIAVMAALAAVFVLAATRVLVGVAPA